MTNTPHAQLNTDIEDKHKTHTHEHTDKTKPKQKKTYFRFPTLTPLIQHLITRPNSRLFSLLPHLTSLQVGKKVGEFLLGSLVAVGLLILAGVLFSAFSGANFLLPLGLGARSLEDFQYAYEIAQQVYSAIENYAF